MLPGLLVAVLAITGFVVAAAPMEEFTIDVGPISIPAGAGHHSMTQPAPLVTTTPVDGWLRGFSVELIDERGRPVSRELLHHVNLIAPQKRELFSQIMLRLAAAGPETQPIRLPAVLGYRLHRGDSLLVVAMLHNPTNTGHRQALVRVHVAYTPFRRWFQPLGIYPFYLDVMPPDGKHAYNLPPGRSEQSWEGSPAIAGRIFGVGGHLHKYGTTLRFQDVTEGKMIWEAAPATDRVGNVTGMPSRFFFPLGIPVKAGHVYRLTAIYDNPTGQTLPDGGMGAFGGALWPGQNIAWPTVQPDHPVYRHDVDITYGGHRELLEHPYAGASAEAHRH